MGESRAPLGELLVQRGLLSEEQLENALAEQLSSGKRLGEILVALGFVKGDEVSHLLAEQFGIDREGAGELDTSLLRVVSRTSKSSDARVESGPNGEQPSEAATSPDEELDEMRVRLAAVQAHLEAAPGRSSSTHEPAPETLDEPEIEPGADGMSAQEAPADPLEPLGEDIDPGGAGRAAELARARLAAVEAELERELRLRAAAEQALETATSELEARRSELAHLRGRLAETAGRPRPDPEAGYVLFVPTGDGYRLLSRSGQPPEVGNAIGTSGGALVVVRLGTSPLPGDRRPCVYLQAP